MIEEMIEDLRNLSQDEVADAIVEISTSLRDLEVQFYKTVGDLILSGKVNEIVVKELSGKRQSFFEKAKMIAYYWNDIQGFYTKEKSLTDLVAYINKEILKKQKTVKRVIPKKLVEKRYEENLEQYEATGDLEAKNRAEEDEALLREEL
jgi:hypothetical protein